MATSTSDNNHLQNPNPTQNPNPENQIKKRKRSNGGEKEQRKVKFMNKILSGDKATQESSFKKRKPTLKKKAKELEILCDVKVCMICYGADGNRDTWPKNPKEFKEAIELYKEFSSTVASKNIKFDQTQLEGYESSMDLDLDLVSELDSKINSLKEKIASLNEAKRSQEAPAIINGGNCLMISGSNFGMSNDYQWDYGSINMQGGDYYYCV